MSEMVERVARAILSARGMQATAGLLWDDSDPILMRAANEARAAIAAMREPTEAMVQAVRRHKPYDMDLSDAWPIAIDEALR